MSRSRLEILRRREPLRVGFLPVSDSAPLIYAREAGLFDKYELEVQLSRESSWTDIRDKVISGELDAAQAPATLPFLTNLGMESDPCVCVTGLVISLQGSAIAVSRRLWEAGVRNPVALRDQVYKNWGKHTYTFGVASAFSPQDILLRRWLRSAGIAPDVEVRIVSIRSDQAFPMLKLGYLDGFCVGEPWTSVAVQAGVGVCVASSADLAPLHPEKVLMARHSFAVGRADEHERMLAAILEACAFCDSPQNRPLLADMLAHPHYVNAPAECLRNGLVGPFECGDFGMRSGPEMTVFHRLNANEPDDEKAAWLMNNLYDLLQQRVFRDRNLDRTPALANVFRLDIYQRAKAALLAQTRQLRQDLTRYQPEGNAVG